MNEDLILTLQNYWFSEKEAKIYLTALSMWAAPASSIARNSNESRTTVYSILWDLVKKWYCSAVVRENVTYFSAVSPEILVKIQEQKYKKIKEKLPEFAAISSMIWWHSKIKTFEWKNAFKNLFLELASTEVNVQSFQCALSFKDYPEFDPVNEINYYREQKIKKWLASYRIISNSDRLDQNFEMRKDKKQRHERHTLIIPDLFINSKSSIHIFWPNKISVSFLENNYPYVIIIENTHLYNYLKSLFDYVWDNQTLKIKK